MSIQKSTMINVNYIQDLPELAYIWAARRLPLRKRRRNFARRAAPCLQTQDAYP